MSTTPRRKLIFSGESLGRRVPLEQERQAVRERANHQAEEDEEDDHSWKRCGGAARALRVASQSRNIKQLDEKNRRHAGHDVHDIVKNHQTQLSNWGSVPISSWAVAALRFRLVDFGVDCVPLLGANDDVVKIAGPRKVYSGGKVAVRDLSFGLKRGECLGFLGINGAGKTTTMKMLTGDVAPTCGTATLEGFDILTQQIQVRRQISHCPQFGALCERMTVREHIELFAVIKAVTRVNMDAVVTEKIQQLNLADFEHKLAGSLSGNKRKLSVAIALIGSPPIIFLDEPSTGMDPVSRRFMWDLIADISTRGKESTIVLTTHSMEECEALCSRVEIMVGGRLRCYGSVQHLKSRFGDVLAVS